MSIGRTRHGGRETAFNWLAALLAILLGGIHLYLGVTGDEPQFLIVSALFFGGVVFFFTGFWRAVVYLLAALYVAMLGVLWLFEGMQYRQIGVLTGVVSTVFFLLVIYLFYEESELFE